MPSANRSETLTLSLAAIEAGAAFPMRAGGDARVTVVGAGCFGAWTARRFLDAGWSVELIDAHGPAHSRASSGGESRLTRAVYGADEIYTRMAHASLPDWEALSEEAEPALFHRTGILMVFREPNAYADDALAVHRRLGLPTERLADAEIARRYPQIGTDDLVMGLHEPQFGVLMARRAVRTLIAGLVADGAGYRPATILPPDTGGDRLRTVTTTDGESIEADLFVFACGPWLPRLFPSEIGGRMFVTRQEIFFFHTPPGNDDYGPEHLPGWADFHDGELYYGMPSLEGRGFKIAADRHGPPSDPDTTDRQPVPEGLADVRAFMALRFPALADAPLNETRVCHYENSANGDFLIDRHPRWTDTLLVGMGSGHGFKHSPEVGRLAFKLGADDTLPDRRFALTAKASMQKRSVH